MSHDILIVGAGPSGLSTALHLAQLAPALIPRILILEKAHHPRHKLCAGAMVVDAEVVLQRLGLNLSEVPHVDAGTAHFDHRGAGLTLRMPAALRDTQDFNETAASHVLRVIRRDEFDAWLAMNARARGLTIQEGVTVNRVRPAEDRVVVETDAGSFSALVVVGADGSRGVTRGSVLPQESMHTARALEVLTAAPAGGGDQSDARLHRDAERVAREDGGQAHKDGHAYLDFFAVPEGIAGYVWDFPTQVGGQPNRCWGIYDANLRASGERPALRAPLEEEMARHGLRLGDGEMQGHPIRWFSPRKTVAVPRVVLVGDAAGADGIFGEGISIALGHGRLAAQAIHEAFESGDFSFGGYRRRLLLSPLGISLTTRWAITHVLYRLRKAWLQDLVWRVLKPLVVAGGMLLVLNWARRMRDVRP